MQSVKCYTQTEFKKLKNVDREFKTDTQYVKDAGVESIYGNLQVYLVETIKGYSEKPGQKKQSYQYHYLVGLADVFFGPYEIKSEHILLAEIKSISIVNRYRRQNYGAFLLYGIEQAIYRFYEKEGSAKIVEEVAKKFPNTIPHNFYFNSKTDPIVLKLESVFHNLTDDRAIHFYSRCGYQIGNMMFGGSVRMSKRVSNQFTAGMDSTEINRNHVMYYLNGQYEQTCISIAQMLTDLSKLVGTRTFQDFSDQYLEQVKKYGACRLSVMPFDNWIEEFPQLKTRILAWHKQTILDCKENYGLEKFLAKEKTKHEDINELSYDRWEPPKMRSKRLFLLREQELLKRQKFIKSNFLLPAVPKAEVERLFGLTSPNFMLAYTKVNQEVFYRDKNMSMGGVSQPKLMQYYPVNFQNDTFWKNEFFQKNTNLGMLFFSFNSFDPPTLLHVFPVQWHNKNITIVSAKVNDEEEEEEEGEEEEEEEEEQEEEEEEDDDTRKWKKLKEIYKQNRKDDKETRKQDRKYKNESQLNWFASAILQRLILHDVIVFPGEMETQKWYLEYVESDKSDLKGRLLMIHEPIVLNID